jgi:hypothetical protein
MSNIATYCRPCGAFLLPDDSECPFCGHMAVPVDELGEPAPCKTCKGWGVGNVNDYSIAACPDCGVGA